MITLLKMGRYELIETKSHTKVLYLDDVAYAWVEPPNIGEILVISHSPHTTDCVLSVGHYRLYDVVDEDKLSDQLHLELEAGKDAWQGYLLLTGLPDDDKKRARIIPTKEVITNTPAHERMMLGRSLK